MSPTKEVIGPADHVDTIFPNVKTDICFKLYDNYVF